MFTRALFGGMLVVASLAASAAEQISFPSRNSAGAGSSQAPSLSGDGRFVAFESTSSLTPDDTNTRSDVYVYDRVEKTTRLVSDDRGGDQPVISANGRFVAYRSLDDTLTRIRVRDLERGGLPVTASYPIDTSSYDRTAELAAISPEGRFVAYVFRRAPNIDPTYPATLGNQIVVADTVARTAARVRFRPMVLPDNGEWINQLGRVALSADGKYVLLDTTDALTPDDTNGASDVYRAAVGVQALQRISKAYGTPDLGGATQPVFSLDGTTAYFICENPLVPADTDERASIYLSGIGNNFTVPRLITTETPVASLATQGAVSGRFLAYLNDQGRAFVRDAIANVDFPIEPKANAKLSAPVLSGNDGLVAFASKASNLSPKDGKATLDVFVTPRPGEIAPRTPPSVSVTLSNGSAVPEGSSISVVGLVKPGSGAHELLTIEIDGVEAYRTGSLNLMPPPFTVTRGIHDVRARAFNDAWLEGTSALTPLIVVPANGKLGITGNLSLDRKDAADGSATFNATLRIDNRRASATQPLQVVVTITSQPQIMAEFQGYFDLVPNRGESILTVIDLPALTSSSFTTASFSGITPPTEITGNGYQGNGWTVLAQLREKSGPGFIDIETPANVLTTYPRLNENTDLPNTGIPVVGPPNGSGFDSGLLQSITINGPENIAAGSGASFRALAIFSNGNQACAPEWSLTGANASRATIDSMGRFTASSVSATTKLTVRAAFGGMAATKTVTIKPTSPIVTVSASDGNASESGDPGQFRLLRTKGNKDELTVNYTLSGKAVNGTDYATLSGTATFPAGASSAVVDVTPQQDVDFEGAEIVTLSLDPGAGYRLKKNKQTASVVISDDEPFPAQQPDLTIRLGKGPVVGASVIDTDPEETTQALSTTSKANKPVTFTISLVNRSDTSRDYTLIGGAPATGFTVRYLDGDTDVTDNVIAGYFYVYQLGPGLARELKLIVTPTSATPLGGSLQTVIQARSGTFVDSVSTIVERGR
jgi:hypothetical protein